MGRWFFPLALLLCFVGCASGKYVIPKDGRYDNGMPPALEGTGGAFEHLLDSVLKVIVSTQYEVEQFRHVMDSGVPVRDPLSPTGYRLMGIDRGTEARSVSGAALLMARVHRAFASDLGVAITTAHLVDTPDTIRTYWWDEEGNKTDLLKSFRLRRSKEVFMSTRKGVNVRASVIEMDADVDLALLTADLPRGLAEDAMRSFPYSVGNSDELDWGNFVYLVGYPRGKPQLIGGIVSPGGPVLRIDSSVNFGFSGAPVVAIRDGLPNFELVGLCKEAPATKVKYIEADEALPKDMPLSDKLLGRLAVAELRQIDYGITYATKVNDIRAFLLRAEDVLIRSGVDVFRTPVFDGWGF